MAQPTKNQQDDQPTPMPIAIVGMSCRLPGEVSTLEEFWRLMSRARSGWSEIPDHRFSKDAYWHPNPEKKGCFNNLGGYFLSQDLACFDAPFFNITAQEAQSLDPQQRILLECTYEALENAGMPKESVVGKNVGVFVGGAASDYRLLRDVNSTPMFDITGNHESILSNRISYYFDLRGPSCTVDTACSSSLYALHHAVQSIRAGESEQAIVAACHINLCPDDFVCMSMSRLFSEEGKTYAFDHRATSGFARGEGAGCLVLKPLDQALRDNDKVRAVIVNTGVNQDGRTIGLTSPSGEAQERLMREVYAKANISPADTGFVEAHGTGTKVGDPIEARALYNVFGKGRTGSARQPLYFGSVKTNVGHLENASGVVSVIKAAMMLERGFILPNINFEKPNEAIPLSEWNMKVPTSQRLWPMTKRFISVNNFGFGGSNAHAVLERPPLPPKSTLAKERTDVQAPQRLFVLSASDEKAAKRSIDNLGVFLEQHPEVFQKSLMRNLAYTLCQRRSHLAWRVALVASSSKELAMALNAPDSKPTRCRSPPPKIAFVYTGQGAQWHAMGRELLDTYPVFGNTMRAADDYLIKSLGADFSLLHELRGREKEDSQVGMAHISQPICTAVQLALTDLLKSWNIQPTAVTGHSSGEIGAAYAAGLLSFESAMAVAYHRGQAVVKLKETHPGLQGAMLAVGASPAEVRLLLKTLRGAAGRAVVACENAPNSVTVSGDADAINELAAAVEREKQWFNRKLRVDVAYHSPHMGLVADDYRAAIGDMQPLPAEQRSAAFYSSLHGKELEQGAGLDAAYWVANLTQPVLFSTALGALCSGSNSSSSAPGILIEIGPHAALEGPIKQTLKALGRSSSITYAPTLVRATSAITTCLALARTLYTAGHNGLCFEQINSPQGAGADGSDNDTAVAKKTPVHLAELAPYPWNHDAATRRYWAESRAARQHRRKPFARHDLLGRLADHSSNTLAPTWTNTLACADVPWLRDHRMQGLPAFPFAGFVCMAVEAAAQRAQLLHGGDAGGSSSSSFDRFVLRDVLVMRPLLLLEDDEEQECELTLTMRPWAEGARSDSEAWDEFRIASWTRAKGWTEHCRGLVGVRNGDPSTAANPVCEEAEEAGDGAAERLRAAKSRCGMQRVDAQRFYADLEKAGAAYGPLFRGVRDLHVSSPSSDQIVDDTEERTAVAVVQVPDTAAAMPCGHETPSIVHAAFLDHVFQLAFPLLGAGAEGHGMKALYMPSAVSEIRLLRHLPTKPGERLHVVSSGCPDAGRPRPTDFNMEALVAEDAREAAVSFEGLTFTPIQEESARSEVVREVCYKMVWEPLDGATAAAAAAAVNGHSGEDQQPLNGNHHSSKSTETNGVNGFVADATKEEPAHSSQVVIVAESTEETSPLAAALADAIAIRTGHAATVTSLAGAVDAVVAGKLCIVLSQLDHPCLLSKAAPDTFAQVQRLLISCAGVLWVTRGAFYKTATNPEANMAVGLIRTLRSETMKKAATLDLDPHSASRVSTQVELIVKVFKRAVMAADVDGVDMEYAEGGQEDGQQMLLVPRVVPDEATNLFVHRESCGAQSAPYMQEFPSSSSTQPDSRRRLRLAIETPGALDTLYFTDSDSSDDASSSPPPALAADEIELHVAATGMNFKDVVTAMGQLPSLPSAALSALGIECAGTVTRVGAAVSSLSVGARVCAFITPNGSSPSGAYGTHARCRASSAAALPPHMAWATAASLPVAFCTAYAALVDAAHLAAGERVLIHAAAGGLGQACVQLAQALGAGAVFATVGSAAKKRVLVDTYGIPPQNVFCSRDVGFARRLRGTVDVVVNCLAGELLRESWARCLGPFGRFVEVGKRDVEPGVAARLDMRVFGSAATFAAVDLSLLAEQRPREMARVLQAVMGLVRFGVVRPVTPVEVVGVGEVEAAFRRLQSGKTMGKVVVVPKEGEMVRATHPRQTDLFRPDASYVIVGGTGGLGRSMARWMVRRGARTVVLLSRRGETAVDAKVAQLMEDVRPLGASVIVRTCDVTDEDSVRALVEQCGSGVGSSLPPIRGVIHAAMVLRDTLFENMAFADYHAVIASKVAGTWNLHNALLNTPLDFFVALSSVAGIVGNRGQAAYAAANAFLDAFARHRRAVLGLPAAVVDLTAVADVGYLADGDDGGDGGASRREEVLRNIGGDTLVEREVLALLAAAVSGGVMERNCEGHCLTGLRLPSATAEDDGAAAMPFYAADAKFERLRAAAAAALASSSSSASAANNSTKPLPLAHALAAAATAAQAIDVVARALLLKLSAILAVPLEDIVGSDGDAAAAGADSAAAGKSVTTYGLDSLNAIELRNWIAREVRGANLQVLELLTSGSVRALAGVVVRKAGLVFGGDGGEDGDGDGEGDGRAVG